MALGRWTSRISAHPLSAKLSSPEIVSSPSGSGETSRSTLQAAGISTSAPKAGSSPSGHWLAFDHRRWNGSPAAGGGTGAAAVAGTGAVA